MPYTPEDWKRRAWQAATAMRQAMYCRKIEDMRQLLNHARLELESYFVVEQNEAAMAPCIQDTELGQVEEEILRLYADDKTGKQ